MQEDRELIERVSRIEGLLAEFESFPNPEIHRKAQEMVESLLLMYGEGLNRMLNVVWEETADEARSRIFDGFIQDEVIDHLLLLHDLHPVPVEARVARALDEVRPYLASHGGNVELLGVIDGVAHLRMQGSCSGCPSSTVTLKLAIEEAIHKAAPDLMGIEAEGVAAPPARPANFIPMTDLMPRKAAATGPAWTDVGGLPHLAAGGMETREVSGSPTVFFNLDGDFYAYRDACPQCGHSLHGGSFQDTTVACPQCARRYDIRLAGRCLDASGEHLDPVPLLVQGEVVKVAVHG